MAFSKLILITIVVLLIFLSGFVTILVQKPSQKTISTSSTTIPFRCTNQTSVNATASSGNLFLITPRAYATIKYIIPANRCSYKLYSAYTAKPNFIFILITSNSSQYPLSNKTIRQLNNQFALSGGNPALVNGSALPNYPEIWWGYNVSANFSYATQLPQATTYYLILYNAGNTQEGVQVINLSITANSMS